MSYALSTPVQYLKGVGPKMAKKLANIEIKEIKDLLYYFPRTYIDFNQIMPIKRLRIGDTAIIKAKVLSISNHRSQRKRMVITKAKLEEVSGEGSSEITAVWFNQPFLINFLKSGSIWYFYGKINYDFNLRKKILLSPTFEKKSAILPIYPLTEGITSKYLRKLIAPLLSENLSLPDFLPDFIIDDYHLMNINQAVREIHFPISQQKLSQARNCLAFDEMFLIILRLLLTRKDISVQKAAKIKINKKLLIKFVKGLPYQLTNAQRKASWEIINDLAKSVPMNRLLEGDVGSGKTVVALMAALNTIESNYQVLWMAPTEILATQHFQTARQLLKKFDIQISIITSKKIEISDKKIFSNKLQAKSYALQANLIIGTHALIQKDCKYKNIGLVIIDEQHRFGVKQRAELAAHQSTQADTPIDTNNTSTALRSESYSTTGVNQCNKSQNSKLAPHFLSMTATPIPRTLALSIYSDLDISILDEMPKNRKKIITRLVDPVNRDKAYRFIRDQVKLGRQVFIICPLIEENSNPSSRAPHESKLHTGQAPLTTGRSKQLVISNKLFDLDRKSVKEEYKKLSKQIFPDLKISMLHGKMKSNEKEKIMSDFSQSKTDILVSTSVVEVGIDVPNATIIMIEDAERFGLAQLHQFRGRVGRGQYQSYCLLFTNNLSNQVKNRLDKLVVCSDGFKLAQEDLELRGSGELVGNAQSGLLDLKMAKLTDIILMKKVHQAAEQVIVKGIDRYSELTKKLAEFESTRHLE